MNYDPFAIVKNAAKTKENPSVRQLSVLSLVCIDRFHASVDFYAEKLGFSKPVVTRAIDRLVQLNFVKRKIDPSDHRKVIVTPTTIGCNYIQSIQPQ